MKRRRVIHVHLVHDDTAVWIESKHPRRGKGPGGGQFTGGGAGVGGAGGGGPKVGERAGKGGIVRPGGWWGREANVGRGEAKGETSGWTEVTSGLPEHNLHPDYHPKPHGPAGSVWGEAGRPPFDPKELDRLPEKAYQPQHLDSWEKMKEAAHEGHQHFSAALEKVAKALGHQLEPVRAPDELTHEELGNDKGHVFVAPLKREARSKEKVQHDYKGDWSQLKDVIRGTIAVPHIRHIREAIKAVEAAGLKLAMQPKDKFSKPTPEGYRDLNTVVKLPNGMLAELQYNIKPIAAAKQEAHGHYEKIQKMQRFHGSEEPTPTWPIKHVQRMSKLREHSRAIYDPVWKKVTSPP